ncbi:MAG TPA: hypothetical protein P5274_03270 [Candidatus Paceibacterota bacterium]|nr:hypothetical protein [Candidatus Paceibacterota bacterium]
MASEGGGSIDFLWAIIIVIVLFVMWVQGGGPSRAKDEGLFRTETKSSSLSSSNSSSQSSSVSSDKVQSVTEKLESQYKGQIRLGQGTSASTYQPGEEYITISASGNKEPVKIGGWVLRNGRSDKLHVVSGNTVSGQSVFVRIPDYGVAVFDPYNPSGNKQVPLTLKSGERAIITTGNPPVFSGVKIMTNFKINRCLGYLEDDTGYKAYPRLTYRCPSSDDVPGITYLDDACYRFARSVRACHTPKDIYVKDEGYCLDGNCKLTSFCRNFITQNYGFRSCFNNYSRDDDFVGPEWRVFLNRTWELWGDRRDSITLYDSAGKLVDKISY